MRYNLGYMDSYVIDATGSTMEHTPMYKVYFRSPVDPVRLEKAIRQAIEIHPLFGTKVEFDKGYYLKTNTKPIVLIHAKEEDRPKVYGAKTNGYTWQCSYYEKEMTFEWMHGTTDGVGAMNFLRQILLCYCGADDPTQPRSYPVGLGLEPFYDPAEKGVDYTVDPEGFSFREFPKIKNRGYRTDCYYLKADSAEISELTRACESSFAPVIALICQKAIRKHLPAGMKNRNVACNIVLDLRRPLHYETMHNCIDTKRLTYLDRHDGMSFREVAGEYKESLDNARRTENIVRMVTERLKLFRILSFFKNEKMQKLVLGIAARLYKDTDCNFTVSYVGKLEFPDEVMREVEDIQFKAWHDVGEGNVSCVDYNGSFNMTITDNYAEKGILEDVIKLSEELGIHWKLVSSGEFEQAHFER